MISEAPLEDKGAGLTPTEDGWFTVNIRDTAWIDTPELGAGCLFEGKGDARFKEFGVNIQVLQPGQPNGMYHRENAQEDFLVLSGECLLIVEERERHLGPWDFVHCPAETNHIFVGAGDGPCVILMIGTRVVDEKIVYPVSETATKRGAGVEAETTIPAEAYERYDMPTPGRPDYWDKLPWA